MCLKPWLRLRPATLVGPAPDCQDAAALYRAAGVPERLAVKQ